jgi:hypothetical protein
MTSVVTWHACTESSAGTLRIGMQGDEHVAEWEGLATLRAKPGGTDARLTFAEGCPDAVRDKLTRGGAMLLLRQLEGRIALHGAAVARRGLALLVLGASGAGKSTLVDALVTRHGWDLVADDALALEEVRSGYEITPSESEVWLAEPGGGRMKVARPALRRAAERARVIGVVCLSFAPEGAPCLRPVPPLLRARSLVASFVRFALHDRGLLALEATRVTELSARLEFHELARPRELGRLDDGARLLTSLVPT